MVLPDWASRNGVPNFEPHGQGRTSQCHSSCINNEWKDKPVPPKARDAERVVLVEFDNVLFRTPDRPR